LTAGVELFRTGKYRTILGGALTEETSVIELAFSKMLSLYISFQGVGL
jgi:hypothetical protein